MTLRSAIARFAGLLLLTGCGGGTTTGPGTGTGTANFSAQVDGASWASASVSTAATASAGGTYTLVGSTLGAGQLGMSFILYSIGAPGTYPLGVGGTVRGGIATLSAGGDAWSTPLSGSAGSVTLTDVSATHIAGTFHYVATPFVGAPSNSRTVTGGSFDLPVTAHGSVAVADNAGNRFGGTLGGAPWNAATVVMISGPSSGTLAVGIGNNAYSINIIVSGWTGTGVYALNSGVSRQITVTTLGGPQKIWGGSGGLSSGTVTVTAQTATRIQGSYDVTLQPVTPSPGDSALTLTGTFDLGIPQ